MFLGIIIGTLMVALFAVMAGVAIYRSVDHGKVVGDGELRMNGAPVGVTHKNVGTKNSHRWRTTVLFDDGFEYITFRTKVEGHIAYYTISVTSEMHQEIIEDAKIAHQIAYLKYLQKVRNADRVFRG